MLSQTFLARISLSWAVKCWSTNRKAHTSRPKLSLDLVPEQRTVIQELLQRRWSQLVEAGFICHQAQNVYCDGIQNLPNYGRKWSVVPVIILLNKSFVPNISLDFIKHSWNDEKFPINLIFEGPAFLYNFISNRKTSTAFEILIPSQPGQLEVPATSICFNVFGTALKRVYEQYGTKMFVVEQKAVIVNLQVLKRPSQSCIVWWKDFFVSTYVTILDRLWKTAKLLETCSATKWFFRHCSGVGNPKHIKKL